MMKLLKKIPLPNCVFRLGLLLLAVKSLASFSVIIPYPSWLDDGLSMAGAMCLAAAMFSRAESWKHLVVYGAALMLTLHSASLTGTMPMFLTVVTCLAVWREDFRETVKFLLIWEGAYVLLHSLAAILMSCVGIPMVTVVNRVERFNFGFSHPNIFSIVIMNLLCLWIWLRFENLKLRDFILLGAAALACYLVTDTRSMLYAVGVLLVLLALRRWDFILRFVGMLCLPLGAAIEYFLWWGYETLHPLSVLMDRLLSGRIRLGGYALSHFGLTILGQTVATGPVKWDELWRINSFTFDDIYSNLAMVHGVVWLVILAVLFIRSAWRGSTKTAVFIILWALYGTTEVHALNPYLFFPILLTAIREERHE